MSIEIDHYLNLILESDLLDSTSIKLRDSIRYSLLAGGKRIRPRLALATGQLVHLPQESSLAIAAAIEILHCFTLIHDDLPCMDDDDFRRGKPANHKVFGEAIALLAGDAMIPLAIQVFLRARGRSFENERQGLLRFLQCAGPNGVMGGQALELELSPSPNLNDLLRIHKKKTAALFEASVLIPMEFQGIQKDSASALALTRFAEAIGLAFQVIDDLEDGIQDGDTPALNITHYMPEAQAKDWVEKQLNEAGIEIVKIWKERGRLLTSFSEELIKRVRLI